MREVFVRRTGPAEIEGWARQGNQYTSDVTVHFVVRLSRPFGSMDAWERRTYEGADINYGTEWRAGAEHRGGPGSGVVLNLATTEGEQTLVRTGLSLVDLTGARGNLDAEQKGDPTFEDGVAAARAAWSPILDRVQVEGGPDWARAAFYTNLYGAYSGKSIVNDVDGRYRDACEQVRTLRPPAHAVYSSDGFWGTQWTVTPVWTLLTPDLALSWVHALLELADTGGWIPTAPVDLEYAPIMTAQHQQSLIVSAWQKGLRGFDAEKAWAAIEHDLTTQGVEHECGGFAGNRHLAAYLEHGYVPEEVGPVSNTLEYAYDDWTASQLALALGKHEAAERLRKRSESWRNVFDPGTGYVRRKHADGRWLGEEDEGQVGALFVLLSMGLFEMDGGTSVDPSYDIGSPLFDRCVIHLDPARQGGRTFTIESAAQLPGERLRSVGGAERRTAGCRPPPPCGPRERWHPRPADGTGPEPGVGRGVVTARVFVEPGGEPFLR